MEVSNEIQNMLPLISPTLRSSERFLLLHWNSITWFILFGSEDGP